VIEQARIATHAREGDERDFLVRHIFSPQWESPGYQTWTIALCLAVICAAVYLAVRPPLFDFDGYSYLLDAVGPDRLNNIDPVHVLWEPIELGLLSFIGTAEHPPTAPFQIVGIVLNCFCLFFFCALLCKRSGSRLFAVASALFIAFSPRFWYLGFQNEPYPILFLALVLYLFTWSSSDGKVPTGLRLAAGAVCLATGILVHQAAVFFVPAGVIALVGFGGGTITRRIVRGLVWGGAIAALVLPVYLYVWKVVNPGSPFLSWAISELTNQHPLQVQFPGTAIKSIIGALGAVAQDGTIQPFLDKHFSRSQVFGLYGGIGAAICAGAIVFVWRTNGVAVLLKVARSSALFTMSLLSMIFWSAIVIAYEPVTPNYWLVDVFLALVCVGVVIRERQWRGVPILAGVLFALAAMNAWLDYMADQEWALNAPERLVASIDRYVGKQDIFIVLADHDWYGEVEYELLFYYLRVSSDPRGVAILNDFLLPAKGSRLWREQLQNKINSTLNSCHRVFVAANVLDPDSYADLAGNRDPFSPFVHPEYLGLKGEELLKEVEQALEPYELEHSELTVGADEYFAIRSRSAIRPGCLN